MEMITGLGVENGEKYMPLAPVIQAL